MIRAPTLRMPLQVVLPLLISFLALGSVTVVTLLFYAHADRTVRRLANQSLGQIHDRIEDRLREYFEIAERVSRMNRETIEMGRWDRHDLASWRGAFYEQVRGFETISSILWGDVFGGAVFVSRYPGEPGYRFGVRIPSLDPRASEYRLSGEGQLADKPITVYDYDPRNRPWYLAAIEAQKPVWGGVYTWVPKENMEPVLSVPFVAPVFGGNGEMLGVFDVEFSLHDLGRFLNSLTIGHTGLAYVMDQDGLLIASSVGAPVVATSTGKRLRAQQSSHPLIAASAPGIGARFMEDGSMAGRVSSLIEVDGNDVMVMATPFNRVGHLRWLAVTLVPADDFLEQIKSARNLGLMVAVIAALASAGIGVRFASSVARPDPGHQTHAADNP